MYRTAMNEDLRYLHQSLEQQRETRHISTPHHSLSPDSSGSDEDFFGRLREQPRLRNFEEHLEGVTGLPLDAVQLLMRSELPEEELPGQERPAAAILKTRHDLHFWEPLSTLGLSQSFRLHRKALESDRIHLTENQPPASRPALYAAWEQVWTRLEKALEEQA